MIDQAAVAELDRQDPLAHKRLDFALPEEDDNPPVVEKEDSVLIEIQPSGELIVDQKPMRLEEILPYLEPKLVNNPKKPVIIRPDPISPYKYMVAVLDELRQATDKSTQITEDIRISVPTQREIEALWF